ncbi:proline-rich protein 18 [Genypterus blacodes]|uniref:proline-rich protein 18 n=1 Tax=Genypterus blacodes TaxID=154954 RepID=UPI003F75F2B5
MPFPPISLQQRISSPGRDLFGKKKANAVPSHTELTSKSGAEKREADTEKHSTSWSSANLRNLGRKSQQQKSKSPALKTGTGEETEKSAWLTVPRSQDTSNGVRRSSSMDSSRLAQGKEEAVKEIQFTLSLTPEAILVIQKRNLEKQMMAKQQKCCASADLRHRRVFASKKAHGGSKSSVPVATKVESEEQDDITAIVKISLLNDQYKYDDVEYEEEDGDVDETVVRKCKEWLKGVESAAALGKVDKLSTLPHLKGC